MNLRLALLTATLAWLGGALMAAPPKPGGPAPLMIADFEEPEVLDRIHVTSESSISLSDRDVVSGKHCLEVRVKPFSTHGNQWPYVFLIDKYFTAPLDLSHYSRVVASVRNVTEGLATVQMTLSSKPYNDGGRNLEGRGFVIPGGTTMQCSLPTSLFRNPINDPSSVQALMFVFPANETDAIYRIDAIQAIYDPAVGSPANMLAADADSLLQQIQGLERRVNWQGVPPVRAAALRQSIPELATTVREIQKQVSGGPAPGQATLTENRGRLEAVTRRLGESVLADKTDFYLWQRPRYTYVRRDALPTFASPPLDRIDLKMARNEFRDATWMVTACDRDVELRVGADVSDALTGAIQLRWSDFVQPNGLPEYADVLVPLEGTLKVPQGESRELWLTVDTRWHTIKPGRHDLSLELTDVATGTRQTVPVSLTVWPIDLPSYDILPNNAYVEYHNSEVGAQVPDEGIRHAKMYGVNMIYVYPHELPWPVKVDAQPNITTFDTTALVNRMTPILKAWRAAPGDEHLQWVFSLSGGPDRLLEDKTIAYPSAQWKQVFGQWLQRFRELMISLGVADDEWMFVLGDEASESVLMTYEIPFAEMIKSLDGRIRLTCNASQVINDKAMAARFFRAFDILQPCLDSLKASPGLREFLGVNRRPLWTYRCESMAGLDRNLYGYYRVYAWDNLKYGISGTGVWTYCAQGESPWSKSQRGIAYNLVFKHRDKPEVIHSRRYEFYREGGDDYRYVQALLSISRRRGAKAEQESRQLVDAAIADITANTADVTRCEKWRHRIAERILKLQ